MDTFIHQLGTGLATGGIYASVALAVVIIYRSTHLINFAQGEMATSSTMLALVLLNLGLPYWLAFAATVAVSFAAGAAIQRVVIRPVQGRSEESVVVVFIGLLLVIHSLNGWASDHQVSSFPSPFPKGAPFGPRFVSAHELGSLLVTLAMVAGLWGFFNFTGLGLAMRAAAQNPVSSRLVGIRVDRMLALGWGLAAAAGAVAGMMVAPVVFLDANMMLGVLIFGFAGALVGGLENPWGAVAGGLLVGVAENLLGAYVTGTELRLTVAVALIVLVLLLRPHGLFGTAHVRRV